MRNGSTPDQNKHDGIVRDAAGTGATAPADPRRRRAVKRSLSILLAMSAGGLMSACGGGGDGADGGEAGIGGGGTPSSVPLGTDPVPTAATDPQGASVDGMTPVQFVFPALYRHGPEAVFVTILGHVPFTKTFGYVDPRSGTLVAAGNPDSFQHHAATMAFRLSDLIDANGRYLLRIPALESGRVYMAFGNNFDAMPGFGAGGPQNGPENPVHYDKFELDTATNPNANMTNVDFFAMPFSLSAVDVNTGQRRSMGFSRPLAEIMKAFSAAGASVNGNAQVFAATSIRNAAGEVVRVLAPKAAGLSDWAGATLPEQVANARMFTHFWDAYVTRHCWVPNRVFSCFGKDLSGPVYHGRVDPAGSRLYLYTDAARTVPYAPMPSLPRPCAASHGLPNYSPMGGQPDLYHNTNGHADTIDWGFLLGGNTGGNGDGAHWNADPVAMAIMMAICRGVMHLDNGCVDWVDSKNFYRGRGDGVSTADMPVFWYAQVLHQLSIDHAAYAFSYDDVYGADPSIYIHAGETLTVTFPPA